MKPNGSKKNPDVRIWGLTGGIASGKSTVARIFSEAGVAVLDADQIARELRAPGGAAYDEIVRRFGTADPTRLRELVFSDPSKRQELESLLHPLIREESSRRISEIVARAGKVTAPVQVIYEAALLVETGRYRDFHGLIVVSADEPLRVARIRARDLSSEEQARKILSAQIADSERRSKATFVIENHGSLEDLRTQVLALLPRLRT